MKERSITVSEFIEDAPASLHLRAVRDERLSEVEAREFERQSQTKLITSPRIQKLGLALAGFKNYIHPGRIQIFGKSEMEFLASLTEQAREQAITNLDLQAICCVLLTRNIDAPPTLLLNGRNSKVAFLQTSLSSSEAISVVSDALHIALAPREVRHGVLLDIYGLGVLLEGRSGIGKSECALDLLTRGHRLIADDAVEVRRIAIDCLQGAAVEGLGDNMEIRGLGIINARDVFGVSAVGDRININLVINLERWSEAGEIDRLGLERRTQEILEVPVACICIPVSSGRNLAVLVETAARVYLLRLAGRDGAREFIERHTAMLQS